ncbi:MAG TPA: hypothetical protein VGV09_03725 [Steroidobacteraceae bacterium]|nr:hypothetical protein [Steroidobacteraceae bacterium]
MKTSKTLITALVLGALVVLGGCVAVPTRHGLVVAPIAPVVGVGVGYDYGYHYGYGPYYRR